MHQHKNILRIVAAIILLSTLFSSCKKDTAQTQTVIGSAGAGLVIGSAASVVWSSSSATFTSVSGTVDITADGSNSSKLVLHLTGITATGTYSLATAGNYGKFTYSGTQYSTLNNGGGNVIITTLTATKIEGTFLVESHDSAGTGYCSLSSGKFSIGQ